MWRFSCRRAGAPGPSMQVDPVCGKHLADDDVAALGSYEGVTYAFCSMTCSREFDKEHGDYYVPPPEAG